MIINASRKMYFFFIDLIVEETAVPTPIRNKSLQTTSITVSSVSCYLFGVQ